MILAKKEYIKPITEAIMIDTICQMLYGSGEYPDEDVDLEASKMNYWAMENAVLNI